VTLADAAEKVYLALGHEPYITSLLMKPSGVYGSAAGILVDSRVPEAPGQTQLWWLSYETIVDLDEPALAAGYRMMLRRARRTLGEARDRP